MRFLCQDRGMSDIIIISFSERKMRTNLYETYQTSDSQECQANCFQNYFLLHSQPVSSSFNFCASLSYPLEVQPQFSIKLQKIGKFKTKIEKNILICHQQEFKIEPKKTSALRCEEKPNAKKKGNAKKPVQKQSRNVFSNILRIFFKSTLEGNAYDSLICKIIRSFELKVSKDEFYLWLQSFGINFKNYIRYSELQRLLNPSNTFGMRLILTTILRSYLHNEARPHCLTSRRIETAAIAMHLKGIRDLLSDLRQLKR